MQTDDSLEKSLMLGKIEGKRRGCQEDEIAGQHHCCNEHELEQTPRDGGDRGAWVAAVHGSRRVRYNRATEQDIRKIRNRTRYKVDRLTTSMTQRSSYHDVLPGSVQSTLYGLSDLNLIEWVSESCSVVSDTLRPCRLYSPWNSPGQNTGVGSLFLLQGIFPTQGSNPGLPHCR